MYGLTHFPLVEQADDVSVESLLPLSTRLGWVGALRGHSVTGPLQEESSQPVAKEQ